MGAKREFLKEDIFDLIETLQKRVDELERYAVMGEWLSGSAAWDPASMADGAVVSKTVTVTGAVAGERALAAHDQIGANDVLVSAHVQSANTVRVVLQNNTGGALDISSGTVYAWVMS